MQTCIMWLKSSMVKEHATPIKRYNLICSGDL